MAHISNQFFLHGLRTTLYGVLLYLVGSGSAAAQADYGAQLAELVQHQLAAEAEVEAAEADCQGTWDAVRQYIGPVSNPLEPRDKACKDHVESSGRRVEGFGDCSSRFFAAYDEHHKKYRICFDRQSTAIENLINIHKKRLDLDRVARAVARTNGNAPAEPNGEKGWLGVRYSGISGKDMERFGLATDQGVIVTKLRDDSPAMRAGILEDDVITSVNDDPVVDRKSFGQAMKGLQAGQMIVLDIIRTGERRFTYVAIEVR